MAQVVLGNEDKRCFGNQKVWFEYIWQPSGKKNPDGTDEQQQIEVTWVQAPGGDKTPVRTTAEHIRDYPNQYSAWKEGAPVPTTGTPLADWTALPKATFEELRHLGFETHEQLSEPSEQAKLKLGPLVQWSKKSKEFLKSRNSTQAQLSAIKEELEREKEKSSRYEQQIAQLQKRIQIEVGA